MSLRKAIQYGKERRQKPRRPCGPGCDWCRNNRLAGRRKVQEHSLRDLKEFRCSGKEVA